MPDDARGPAAAAPRRSRLVSGLLLLGIAIYAVLAWGSALDRASPDTPGAARLVPAPMAGKSALVAARADMAAGRYAAAGDPLAQAIARNPIDVALLSTYGLAKLNSGDYRAAQQAMLVAVQLGWRDTQTQGYFLQAALEGGDWENASYRLDAILRDDPQTPGAESMLANFETSPPGRKVLLDRLAARPDWLADTYLADAESEALLRRAPIVVALATHGLRLGCDAVAPLVMTLVNRQLYGAAWDVRAAHCESGRTGSGVGDETFASVDFGAGGDPLGWRLLPGSGITVVADLGGGLVLTNEGLTAEQVLIKPVRLRPGKARIMLSGNGTQRLAITLDCGGSVSRPAFGGDSGRVVAVPDCPVQTMRVWLERGAGSVSLKRLAAAPGSAT